MATAGELSIDEARQIGVEGYVYFYPLVLMGLTRRQMTNGPVDEAGGRGPAGAFVHVRAYPRADFRDVVRPNFDTLYSAAWVDIATEPVIVSAPASRGRYYMLPCLDMWTDVFAVPGTRTSGSEPISFALCQPGWSGALPDAVERIEAPTPTVWIIGRTQTNGPSDYPAVHAFQNAMSMTPLSAWGETAPVVRPVTDPAVDADTAPMDQVAAMSAAQFFALAADLVAINPPHRTDWSQLARLRRIGFEVGRPYVLSAQSRTVQDALAEVPTTTRALLMASLPKMGPVINGWMMATEVMGVYGDHYLKRAVVALVGLGANQAEDAVYPVLQTDANGKPLDGAQRYVIHFDADRLPPAHAFWSITMYDKNGFQTANELNRFAIGDRDQLRYNSDGSLDIYLQHDNPGPDKVNNWLPSPAGPLGVTMRLYQPDRSVLFGEWTPPPVRPAP
jgi:hypothetical protein